MPEIVFDCCVISNFALAGALDVIEALFGGKAFITDFVAAELSRGIQAGHARLEDILEAERTGRLKRAGLGTEEERRLLASLSRPLGLGEASSIAVAKSRGLVFASDDRAARTDASALDVPLTGTLGILTKAVRAGVRDLRTADDHLGKMVKAGFFSPIRSIKEIKSD
jgi:predicted nucleic acid-binding protein